MNVVISQSKEKNKSVVKSASNSGHSIAGSLSENVWGLSHSKPHANIVLRTFIFSFRL